MSALFFLGDTAGCGTILRCDNYQQKLRKLRSHEDYVQKHHEGRFWRPQSERNQEI